MPPHAGGQGLIRPITEERIEELINGDGDLLHVGQSIAGSSVNNSATVG